MTGPEKENTNEEQPEVDPETVEDLDVEDSDVTGGARDYGMTYDVKKC